jgi:hypothetical protein
MEQQLASRPITRKCSAISTSSRAEPPPAHTRLRRV